MKPCANCAGGLGFHGYLTMNTGNRPTCPKCAERYAWDVNGRLALRLPVRGGDRAGVHSVARS